MKASTVSFLAAVAFVLVGMTWGIVMAISQDHSTMPAHAHLNLLGWVSLFLFGIYYRLNPSLDMTRGAAFQVWVWIAGTAVLAVGVGLVHSGNETGDPIAAAASFVVFFDMMFFGWLVLRGERAGAAAGLVGSPAE